MRARERPGDGSDGRRRRSGSAAWGPRAAARPRDRARSHRVPERGRLARLRRNLRRWTSRRIALAVAAATFVLATFAFFLPQIADYRDVWEVVKGLSWPWL